MDLYNKSVYFAATAHGVPMDSISVSYGMLQMIGIRGHSKGERLQEVLLQQRWPTFVAFVVRNAVSTWQRRAQNPRLSSE